MCCSCNLTVFFHCVHGCIISKASEMETFRSLPDEASSWQLLPSEFSSVLMASHWSWILHILAQAKLVGLLNSSRTLWTPSAFWLRNSPEIMTKMVHEQSHCYKSLWVWNSAYSLQSKSRNRTSIRVTLELKAFNFTQGEIFCLAQWEMYCDKSASGFSCAKENSCFTWSQRIFLIVTGGEGSWVKLFHFRHIEVVSNPDVKICQSQRCSYNSSESEWAIYQRRENLCWTQLHHWECTNSREQCVASCVVTKNGITAKRRSRWMCFPSCVHTVLYGTFLGHLHQLC